MCLSINLEVPSRTRPCTGGRTTGTPKTPITVPTPTRGRSDPVESRTSGAILVSDVNVNVYFICRDRGVYDWADRTERPALSTSVSRVGTRVDGPGEDTTETRRDWEPRPTDYGLHPLSHTRTLGRSYPHVGSRHCGPSPCNQYHKSEKSTVEEGEPYSPLSMEGEFHYLFPFRQSTSPSTQYHSRVERF